MEQVSEVLQKRYDAILYIDFNRPIEAMEAFQQCLQLDTSNIETYNELGLIFLARFFSYSEALIHFRKALAIDDTLFFLHYSIALSLSYSGDYAQACESYRQSIACGGDSAFIIRSYLGIIDICMDTLEDGEIAQLYTHAFAENPQYFLTYYHKARYCFYKGRYHEGRDAILEALQYNMYHTESLYLASLLYARMEQWEEAIAYASQGVLYSEEHPLYVAWHIKLANVYTAYLSYTRDTKEVATFLQALEDIDAYDVIQRILDEHATLGKHGYAITKAILYAQSYLAYNSGAYQDALLIIQSIYSLIESDEEKCCIYEKQAHIYECIGEYFYAGQCYAYCFELCLEEAQHHYAYQASRMYGLSQAMSEALRWGYIACENKEKDISSLYHYISLLFMDNLIKEGLEGIQLLRTYPLQDEYIIHSCVELLYRHSAYRECIRWCELWKQYNPSNYLAYYYHSASRYARQYLQEALENAKYALLLSPSSAECKLLYRTIETAIQATEQKHS